MGTDMLIPPEVHQMPSLCRYAFMPLVDEGSEQEDDEDEHMVNEAFGECC